MRRIRFTIASLLVVVLLAAVGFAALSEASDLWDSGAFTLTLVVLLVSILLAVHSTESRRAFWLVFALFGLAYLGLSLVPSIEPRLLTTKALAYLDAKVPGRSVGVLAFSPGGKLLATSGQGHVGLWDAATGKLLGVVPGTNENFVKIGHCLFALVAGWFGGQLSRRLCRRPGAPDTSVPAGPLIGSAVSAGRDPEP
jgi:hypothetical protein